MKATILHDEHGEIIAISKIGNLKEAGSKFLKASMVPGAGQRALEIELRWGRRKTDSAGTSREISCGCRNVKTYKKRALTI